MNKFAFALVALVFFTSGSAFAEDAKFSRFSMTLGRLIEVEPGMRILVDQVGGYQGNWHGDEAYKIGVVTKTEKTKVFYRLADGTEGEEVIPKVELTGVSQGFINSDSAAVKTGDSMYQKKWLLSRETFIGKVEAVFEDGTFFVRLPNGELSSSNVAVIDDMGYRFEGQGGSYDRIVKPSAGMCRAAVLKSASR